MNPFPKYLYFIVFVAKVEIWNAEMAIFHYTSCKRGRLECQKYKNEQLAKLYSCLFLLCFYCFRYFLLLLKWRLRPPRAVRQDISWKYHRNIIEISWGDIDLKPTAPASCGRLRLPRVIRQDTS